MASVSPDPVPVEPLLDRWSFLRRLLVAGEYEVEQTAPHSADSAA